MHTLIFLHHHVHCHGLPACQYLVEGCLQSLGEYNSAVQQQEHLLGICKLEAQSYSLFMNIAFRGCRVHAHVVERAVAPNIIAPASIAL